MERTWKFISYLFHPLFMPTIGAFMVMWNDPLLYLSLDSLAPWLSVLGVVFICTAAVPLLFSITLVRMGRITSIYEPNEQDRKSLIAFAELGFLLAYLAFRNIPTLGHSIMFFLLGINIAMVITLVVSFFKKISFHTTGIGGIVGTTIGLMYYTRDNLKYWVIGAILAAILVGYARYKLKAHDTFELYLGYIVGIASLALVFIIGAK
jgi:hypothetical protein